jgi:hypothetical protein
MLRGLVTNDNPHVNITTIISHSFLPNNTCSVTRNGDTITNAIIKIKLSKLLTRYEYISHFENLYLDEIQLEIGGQLCQSFTSDYLVATKNKTFRDEQYIYIPIPFQFSTHLTKLGGLPLVGLLWHEVKVIIKLASMNKIINIKYGSELKLQDSPLDAELMLQYVFYSDAPRKLFAKATHIFNYTTTYTQTEKIDVGSDKNIQIYKHYLSLKFNKDLSNYISSFLDIDTKNKSLFYKTNIKLEDHKNIVGLILTVTDDNPDIRMKDNKYNYYKCIEQLEIKGNENQMLTHDTTLLYNILPHIHNKKFKKNVAYIPFTITETGGINSNRMDIFEMNIQFKFEKPKYGNYILKIHYICHVESNILSSMWNAIQ